jgi:hypothetical protein
MRSLVFVLGVVAAAAGLVGCGNDNIGIPPAVCSTTAVPGQKSPFMEPGGDCIGCHSSGEGPGFVLAGTVMSDMHDDTNCQGVADVTIRITGADGRAFELVSNQSGNFFAEGLSASLVFPYKAEVSRNGVTVPMLTTRSASETSCNACHTAAGLMAAPGRIVAP